MLRLRRYTSDQLFKLCHFAPTGADCPKILGRRGRPTNNSFSQKTRLNGHSYGVKISTDLSFALSQSTRLTDRRTHRILIARPRRCSMHGMQRGKNAKRRFPSKLALCLKNVCYKFLYVKTVSDKVVRQPLFLLTVQKSLVGDVPFYLKLWVKLTASERNRQFSICFRP